MISHSNRFMHFWFDGMAVIRGGVRSSGVLDRQGATEREMGIIYGGIVEHMSSKVSINSIFASLANMALPIHRNPLNTRLYKRKSKEEIKRKYFISLL
jgi:hypothetical protein